MAGWLQQRGWLIVPSYDYSGEDGNKAPKMHGVRLSLVIPDLDACRSGERFWVEVKTKWEATFTEKTQRLEHGISLRHYEHYQQVEKESGNPVWLFVLEERTGVILAGRLRDLAEHARIYKGWKMGQAGMVFFPREKFKIVDRVQTEAA